VLHMYCVLQSLAAHRPFQSADGVTAIEYGLIAAHCCCHQRRDYFAWRQSVDCVSQHRHRGERGFTHHMN
jgi:hypothetical protein